MHRIQLPRGEWLYDTSRALGRPGGFGAVFEGQNDAGDSVAVKRLHLDAAATAHRELTIADDLAGKAYEHVLVPLDSGIDVDSGSYFVVMPRAERSLKDLVDEHGPLNESDAVEVLLQIAMGLLEIPHIVHRDLKPANVLSHGGKWKIADFGIARFLEESTSLNTVKEALSPQFAAPEQWTLDHATNSTDVDVHPA
jgi:serine/threonine protein kinase